MISQNVSHLTIKQLRTLIANNGVVSNLDKARKLGKPTEYCLEALQSALNDRQSKAAAKLDTSVMREFIASYGQDKEPKSYTNAFPPIVPTAPIEHKSFTKPVEKFVENESCSSTSVQVKPVTKPKSISFNFGQPLWLAENVCSYLNNFGVTL